MAIVRGGMTADELLERFQRMVRKQDYWRGYVGDDDDSPEDSDVEDMLQDARDALARDERLRDLAGKWESEANRTDGGMTDGLRQAANELREALDA